MKLNEIKPNTGSRKKRKRIGCGPGSGHGKMSTFGMKGQGARNRGVRVGFEGGQMPMIRRSPKRGFVNIFSKEIGIVNLRDLNKFDDGTEVTLELVQKKGMVDAKYKMYKVLGAGELTKKLTVKANSVSKSAEEAIKAKAGSVVLTITRPVSAGEPPVKKVRTKTKEGKVNA